MKDENLLRGEKRELPSQIIEETQIWQTLKPFFTPFQYLKCITEALRIL